MASLKFVKTVWKSFLDSSGLEATLLDSLRITSATPGRITFQLRIEKKHTNRLETLHGGTIASLVDLGGSLAVASRGLHSTGVSTDLNVTYLTSGGVSGERVSGEVICEKLGKSLAFTSTAFRDEKGEVFARGSHTKYVRAAHEDPKNMVEEMKAESTRPAKAPIGPWSDV